MATLTEDRDEIHQLLNAYSHAVDSRDGTRWASLFTEDGAFVSRGGRMVVERAVMAERMTPPRTGLRHIIVNEVITVDGDVAHAESYVLGLAGTPPQIVSLGTYDDTFHRTPEGWKIFRRVGHLEDLEAERPLETVLAYIGTFRTNEATPPTS